MAGVDKMLKKGDPHRYFKDKWIRIVVTGGGVMVLGALLLIFVFLAYLVFPLFQRPDIQLIQQLPTVSTAPASLVGSDNENRYVYQFFDKGNVIITDIKNSQIVMQKKLLANATSFSSHAGIAAYGTEEGIATFYRLQFMSRSPDQPSTYRPILSVLASLQLSPEAKPLTAIAFAQTEKKRVVAGISDDNLYIDMTMKGGETQKFEFSLGQNAQLAVSADARFIYTLVNNTLSVFDISRKSIQWRETINIKKIMGFSPVQLNLLPGSDAVLVRLDNGHVTQWFDVNEAKKRRLTLIREFDTSPGVLAVEPKSNAFVNVRKNGQIALWQAVSATYHAFDFSPWSTSIDAIAFSPRADKLIISQADKITLFDVDNPYSEINIDSLWKRIWYEGYEKADYVWQSAPSGDSAEGKYSVVPLVFGSVKVAAFTLLFAVPLALGGAIYTAYFMTPAWRGMIKPVIELMEALPTVILGFIAGIWLAPLLERHLTFGLTLFLGMPTLFLLIAFVWTKLPISWRQSLPRSSHIFLLIPLILLSFFGLFTIEHWLEVKLFDGDARLFVTQNLGINFEQRNAIVVGLAMGFAVIPTIFTIAEEAIFSVPKHLTNGSLALGATHWQTLVGVVLLTASPGIFSALMMGFGRAVGETMIVLMATGNTPLMEWNPFEGLRTLSATIAIEMPESQVGSSHYRVLFLTAFLLFSFTFVFNTLAEYVRQQLRDKYRAL